MSLHDVLETVNDNPATLQPMENKQTDMAFDQYKPNYSFILLHSPVSSAELFPTSTVGAFDGLVLRPDPVQEAVIGDPSYPSIQALGDFSANRSFKIDGDSRSFSMIGYSVSYLGQDDQTKSFSELEEMPPQFCFVLLAALLRVLAGDTIISTAFSWQFLHAIQAPRTRLFLVPRHRMQRTHPRIQLPAPQRRIRRTQLRIQLSASQCRLQSTQLTITSTTCSLQSLHSIQTVTQVVSPPW
jgi:hypothetical protein